VFAPIILQGTFVPFGNIVANESSCWISVIIFLHFWKGKVLFYFLSSFFASFSIYTYPRQSNQYCTEFSFSLFKVETEWKENIGRTQQNNFTLLATPDVEQYWQDWMLCVGMVISNQCCVGSGWEMKKSLGFLFVFVTSVYSLSLMAFVVPISLILISTFSLALFRRGFVP